MEESPSPRTNHVLFIIIKNQRRKEQSFCNAFFCWFSIDFDNNCFAFDFTLLFFGQFSIDFGNNIFALILHCSFAGFPLTLVTTFLLWFCTAFFLAGLSLTIFTKFCLLSSLVKVLVLKFYWMEDILSTPHQILEQKWRWLLLLFLGVFFSSFCAHDDSSCYRLLMCGFGLCVAFFSPNYLLLLVFLIEKVSIVNNQRERKKKDKFRMNFATKEISFGVNLQAAIDDLHLLSILC